MDDRLEKFIKSHRNELDDKQPRKDLWAEIENEIDQKTTQRHISKSVMFWRTAAVILLLITSWLAFDKVNQNSVLNGDNEIAEVSPQLLEAESYYISLISEKRKEIVALSETYELGIGFLHDIDMLDSMYLVLKKDMENGNEENLVDAMILNLQLRIEILNQQLSIIQSIENSKRDERVIL